MAEVPQIREEVAEVDAARRNLVVVAAVAAVAFPIQVRPHLRAEAVEVAVDWLFPVWTNTSRHSVCAYRKSKEAVITN